MALLAVGMLNGCQSKPLDIRALLLASAAKGDPDFPDGKGMMLTHFSHVGQLVTSNGDVIYVAERRAVLTGMIAPRGQHYITFFDARFEFLGKMRFVNSQPLWCDGSRLFLFGDLDGVSNGIDGNVIDVAEGFDHVKVYHEHVYGSSGGLDETGL